MNNFEREVYEVYLENCHIENLSFHRISSQNIWSILKAYFLYNDYRLIDVKDVLKIQHSVYQYFQIRCYGTDTINLEDDSDKEADIKFIEFVCTHFSSPYIIFDNHIMKYISELVDDMFDKFSNETKNEDDFLYDPKQLSLSM